MKHAGFFGKILAAISASGNETPEAGAETSTISDSKTYTKETTVATGVETEFVTRHGTHFCPKCGWCDDIEVTMEKKTWTNSKGEADTSYYFIKTDKKPECPKCSKRSVLPLTSGNVTIAVKYLMQSLQ